ncbi:MAG TPA: hypothetical protein VKK79_06970 [Candidatus Lokiarchaeia archaeon]|nr:hypothetical protein [Candidatus Lokiarchaeia archaeon]
MSTEGMIIYGQLENTCGLASTLMATQPERNGFADQLSVWWDGVGQLVDDPSNQAKEFAWERVLDYILLKIPTNDKLRAFVEEQDPDLAMLFTLNIGDRVQKIFARICRHEGPKGMFLKNAYEATGRVCDPLLDIHLGIMKTNADLGVLYCFFGGKFLHRFESGMPTGAIFFTRDEVKNPLDKNFLKKVQILEQAVKDGQHIFLGQTHHWMAVKGLKSFEDDDAPPSKGGQKPRKYFLYVLDPEKRMEMTLPFNVLTENFLFYFFQEDNTRQQAGLQLLAEVLDAEIAQDAEIYQKYLAGDIGDEDALRQQVKDFVGEMEVEEEEEEEDHERAAELAQLEARERTAPPPPKGILTGEQWMERIRAAIKRNFSDYSKM